MTDTRGMLCDLRGLFEAVQPRSASVEAEGELPSFFELNAEADGIDALFPDFETEGHVRETPSRFESSGFFRVGKESTDETHEVRLAENESADDEAKGYVVEGSHVVPGETAVATLLSSTDGVREIVDMVLGGVSENLRSSLDYGVEEHSAERELRDGEKVVVSEYSVRLRGLDNFSGDGNMRVEKAEVTVSRGDELVCSWDFDVHNYGRFFAGILDDTGYEEADALLDARRDSEFSELLDWRADLSNRDAEADVSYEAENGSLYAEELAERGFDTPARTRLSFELDTREEEPSVSFDTEISGDSVAFTERLDVWSPFLPLPVFYVFLRLF